MFGRKKEPKKEKRARPPGSLEQFGIFQVPASLDDLGGQDDDVDDEDLEAELAALTAGHQPKRPAPRKPPPKPAADLDKMINESMKDINSDEDLSGDDDDPDLLNELQMITGEEEEKESPVYVPNHTNAVNSETNKTLQERLSMYKKAENKAKSENETSRLRRYHRGVQKLEELLAAVNLGEQIDSSEIPPLLPPSALGTSSAKPLPEKEPAPEPIGLPVDPEPIAEPVVTGPADVPEAPVPLSPLVAQEEIKLDEPSQKKIDEDTLNLLKNRQREYKVAALTWKKSGNQEEALKCIRIIKQFDSVIAAVSNGDAFDLSDMPPSPSLPSITSASENTHTNSKEESANQKAVEVPSNTPDVKVQALGTAESLEAALKERLEIYRRSKTVAETEGNASKARRYGRICKQFEDALKLHIKGKVIPIDELPTPPGFPPLSAMLGPKPATQKVQEDTPIASDEPSPAEPSIPTEPPKSQERPKTPSPSPSKSGTPVAPPRTNSDKKKKLTSRVDKQIEVLQKRQQELKMAALKAKKEGDLDLARDYLRQAKGIDPLLTASLSGLPVDMTSIPLSPQAKLQLEDQDVEPGKTTDDGFTLISSMECSEEAVGTNSQIYENLEAQLKKQIKWCLNTRDHCKAIGDVSSYNKWGRLALDYMKDLDMVRVRKRDNRPPPQHHYEIKTYSIVQCCTDLTDADIEISILRGTNYTKEVDTYVIFELPWPSDSPSTDRTSTIRDSNNPEYNAVFPLTGIIDRTQRQCQRVFKRHALKCQVWSKGCSLNPILCCTHPRGFFRADGLVGTVNIKLQPLETKCILHDSFPLMDGRKAVGGKLEVKIRLRNPILTKQIEQNTDKWLTIDQ
ncbi:hypothetical protein QAD02_001127 [Eretmocerus hayati]|uniref:Uncharacterized protein n=1 Tax=Eretmocerus hayati TaxID=131215 RepID=A0ACC2NG63_9HYME|nr:hypothetical protein QAD02_001127 [Eretmocerus hayati]